jgi:hypothetical protein
MQWVGGDPAGWIVSHLCPIPSCFVLSCSAPLCVTSQRAGVGLTEMQA